MFLLKMIGMLVIATIIGFTVYIVMNISKLEIEIDQEKNVNARNDQMDISEPTIAGESEDDEI